MVIVDGCENGYTRNPDQEHYENVEELRALLRQYAPAIKLWQGEAGTQAEFCLGGALCKYPWTELTQAKWQTCRMLGDVGHDVESLVFGIAEQVLVCWDKNGVPSNTNDTMAATFTVPKGSFAEPVWVDLITGGIHEIPADKVVVDGEKLVFKDLLVYDAPTYDDATTNSGPPPVPGRHDGDRRRNPPAWRDRTGR